MTTVKTVFLQYNFRKIEGLLPLILTSQETQATKEEQLGTQKAS